MFLQTIDTGIKSTLDLQSLVNNWIDGSKFSMKESAKIVAAIVGFLLLIALLPLPYGYYTFLRLTVFMSSLFLVYQLSEMKEHKISAILALLAILFNPFIPVYLSRELWMPIDLISAGFFLYIAKITYSE